MIELNVNDIKGRFFFSMFQSISYCELKQSIENNNILHRRLKLLILNTLIMKLKNLFSKAMRTKIDNSILHMFHKNFLNYFINRV